MNAMDTCYLLGAGDYYEALPTIAEGDFVIAVDGGYRYAKRHGMPVDLVVGDFDSLGGPPQGEHVVKLPAEKDNTDMLAAIHIGMERGFRTFHIYGGTGGRLDHTLANIQCVAGIAMQGARGYLHDKGSVITAIADGGISFLAGGQGIVSVFSFSDISEGVCEVGLKYTLEEAVLRSNYPVGISNEFTGVPSSISVRRGTLLIIYPDHMVEEKR